MKRFTVFVLLVGACAFFNVMLGKYSKPISCVPEVQAQAQASAQGPKLADWPLFGGTPARNMVNLTDKNTLTDWNVEKDKEKNIKWKAQLGRHTYGGPLIAGGRVFVGTDNAEPRDPKFPNAMSVVMCFDEKTGKFLWQTVHEAPKGQHFRDVEMLGLLCTPVVDGDRLYYVLPESVVVCSDVKDGKVLWRYDMHKELKVTPFHCSNCSPLVVGDLLFVVTGNGVDEQTDKMHDANAPSFIAIDIKTQKLAWKSNLPGDFVFQGQWSNPTYAVIQGKPQVIFPGGDGSLYSFEPATGKLIWEFHSYPRKRIEKDGKRVVDNYFVSTPVVHDNKVYVGLGVPPDLPSGIPEFSYFLCIDATKTGDVSPGGLGPQAVHGKNNALLWSFGGPRKQTKEDMRKVNFKSTLSTCAVHDGLVYIAELDGYMHCLDDKTGQRLWQYDFKDSVWGSPYYVDGKVYICTEGSEVIIFQAARQMKVINKIDMEERMQGTPVICNGVLFIATPTKLYAIAGK